MNLKDEDVVSAIGLVVENDEDTAAPVAEDLRPNVQDGEVEDPPETDGN
jgi:hypothetical protein